MVVASASGTPWERKPRAVGLRQARALASPTQARPQGQGGGGSPEQGGRGGAFVASPLTATTMESPRYRGALFRGILSTNHMPATCVPCAAVRCAAAARGYREHEPPLARPPLTGDCCCIISCSLETPRAAASFVPCPCVLPLLYSRSCFHRESETDPALSLSLTPSRSIFLIIYDVRTLLGTTVTPRFVDRGERICSLWLRWHLHRTAPDGVFNVRHHRFAFQNAVFFFLYSKWIGSSKLPCDMMGEGKTE